MSERQITNRIKKLQELQAQADELNSQIDALKAEIQADMTEKGVDEMKAGNFLVRWTRVIRNTIDSKALKKELPEIAAKFMKQTESRRFSIV